MGFIFGEGTPWTYDEVQRKRKIAEAMAGQIGSPRNVGEGLSAIGKALAVRGIEKRADRRMGELQGEADKAWEGVFGALTGGRTGGGRTYSAPVPPVNSESIDGQSVADDTMRALGRNPVGMPAEVRAGVFAGESGGDYDALYGYQNREGGRYANVKPTDMTVGEVMAFQDPGGDYGQWVKGQVGRVATPVGAYQVVGTTLKNAVRAGVVSPDEKFTPEVQDRVGDWIYKTQGTGAWEGYQGGGGRASPGGQNSLQAIAAAMSNPIIRNDPGKMAVLNAMMGQALTPPEQPKPTSLQQNVEWLMSQGMPMQDALAAAKGGVTVNNMGDQGPPAEPLGTRGQILVYDPSAPGGYRIEVAPGSELAREIEAEQAANEKAAESKGTSANLVLDEIDIARTLIGGESMTSPATGISGGLASTIDSTRAGALKNRLMTIKANIGFDKLQAMRDASPTGGALGQVSEFENRLLQAVFGSLEQSQRAEDLLYNLNRLESIYDRIINEGIPDDEARAMYRDIAMGNEHDTQEDAIPTFNPETGMWE